MPRGIHKSGRFRKIFVKTPGNRVTVHYREREPAKAHCAGCGAVLAGVMRGNPSVLRAAAKTEKRPKRPYGGFFCSSCTRLLLRQKARGVQ